MLRYVLVVALAAALSMVALPSFAQKRPLGLSATQGAGVYREAVGERFALVCDGTTAPVYVYGTDVYTDSSGVCAAAIHAGVLKTGQAGVVTIEIGNGAESFRGSTRNGIATSRYGAWQHSFTFARDGAPGTITWDTVWNGVPADFTAPIVVACPAGGALNGGVVWGTRVYTRDSAICLAAVHAGAISAERGGLIEVARARHSGEFAASTNNGVSSQRYGPYQDAFTVKAARAMPVAAASSAAPGSCPLATAVAQTFDDMKASIARQYDALIRQTENNAAQSAALIAQRDRLLAELETLKRQNLETACSAPPLVTQSTGGGAPPAAGGIPVLNRPPPPVGASAREPSLASATLAGAGGQSVPAAATSSSDANAPRQPAQQPTPQLLSITPASLTLGSTNVEIALRGGGTSWRMGATQIDFGGGVTRVAGPFFTSATEGYVIVAVSPAAQLGPRGVTVTTPLDSRSEVVGLPDALQIWAPPYTVTSAIVPAALAGAVYSPNSSSTTPPAETTSPPAATQPPATPQPPAGWYVVTVNEIYSLSATKDNQLSLDGRGDEIYAAVYRRSYNRQTHTDSQRWLNPAIKTRVYGDAASSTRIQAGSQSAAGGMRALDTIPDGGSIKRGVIVPRLAPGAPETFPWEIWKGQLRDGIDAVAISLSIWESDGKEQTYNNWVLQQERMTPLLWTHNEVLQRAGSRPTGFLPLTPLVIGSTISQNGVSAVLDKAALTLAAIASGGVLIPTNELQDILTGGSDRPIGVRPFNPSQGNASDIIVPNTLLVLTREIIESALSGALPTMNSGLGNLYVPGPGYLIVNFADVGSNFGPGSYSMILQVERTAQPTSTSPQHQAPPPSYSEAQAPNASETDEERRRRLLEELNAKTDEGGF